VTVAADKSSSDVTQFTTFCHREHACQYLAQLVADICHFRVSFFVELTFRMLPKVDVIDALTSSTWFKTKSEVRHADILSSAIASVADLDTAAVVAGRSLLAAGA